jgi:hypothetical protein
LDSLESLPKDLLKNFNQMRDLDSKSQDLLKQIDDMADEYLKKVRSMAGEQRKEHLSGIQKLFNQSKKFGDEKVQLALQTYEMVDKHIRRLDADLARFEAELKDKPSLSGKLKPPKDGKAVKDKLSKDKSGATKDKGGKKKSKRDKSADSDSEQPAKKKKKKLTGGEEPNIPSAVALLPLTANHPSDVLDMPVDPNEPTYCLCHQVSYGEMIGCDNQDCPIEWFHFACVGLTTKPKGKWYCPRCIVERKKKP